MNEWKAYLPEFSLNLQLGPEEKRIALNLHCSIRQRIANLSLEFLPTFGDLYTAQREAVESYNAFEAARTGCGSSYGVN